MIQLLQALGGDSSTISLAACEAGSPNHSSYQHLLSGARSLQGTGRLINTPRFKEPDRWQVQIQAIIQHGSVVYVYSDGLSGEDLRSTSFIPYRDLYALIDCPTR